MSSVVVNTWAGVPNSHLRSFEHFPRLAIDIRLLIWEETCRQGRVVTVFPSGRVLEAQYSHGHGDLTFYVFNSHNSRPAIMHVNHEAEAVAQKFYRLAFDTQPEFPLVTAMDDGTSACIWINPSCDLICPMSPMTNQQCDVLNAKMFDMKVQRIGLNDCALKRSTKIPCDKWGAFPKMVPPIWMNENIKEVTLYTSLTSLLPHGELNLTEFDYATANLTPNLKKSKLTVMRQHNKFFENLRRVQKLQLREDAKSLSLGLALSRINDCPQWLYDCRHSWCKPNQRSMTADAP